MLSEDALPDDVLSDDLLSEDLLSDDLLSDDPLGAPAELSPARLRLPSFLKSVSYQPPPLRRKPAAEIFLISSGLMADRADGQRRIRHFLELFQLVAASLTAIFVNGHGAIPETISNLRFRYSVGRFERIRDSEPGILPENAKRPDPFLLMLPPPDALSEIITALDFSRGECLGVSNQGEVRRFQLEHHDLAIKQPKGRGLAWTVRAATLKREYLAYQRLAGLSGIPACHGLFPGHRLALDFVDGTPLRQAALDPGSRYFDALLTLIQAMHARGVAHGDLKRKANLLVDAHGQPVILDFGTATLRKAGWHPLNQRLFRFICQTDLNAWIKLKYGGYDKLSPEDATLFRRTRLERLASVWRRRS